MKSFLLKLFGPRNLLILYLKFKDFKKKIKNVIDAIRNLFS